MTIFKSVVATLNCKFHVKKSTLLKLIVYRRHNQIQTLIRFEMKDVFKNPNFYSFSFLYRCLGMLEYYSVKPEDVYN